MLPACGHTFCRPCLICMKDANKTLNCPTCRKKHTGTNVAQLAVNFIALSLVDSHKQTLVPKPTAPPAPEENRGPPVDRCSTHGDPKRLWCRSCQEDICGQCLYEKHRNENHTVVSAEVISNEIKGHVKVRTSAIMEFVKENKEILGKEIHEITLKLAQIHYKSTILSNCTSKVNSIVNLTNGSYTVKCLFQLNNQLTKLRDQTEKMLNGFPTEVSKQRDDVQARLVRQVSLGSSGNNVTPVSDKVKQQDGQKCLSEDSVSSDVTKGQVTSNETSCKQDPVSSSPRKRLGISNWQLLNCAPGGSKQWPVINWNDFLTKLPITNLMVRQLRPMVSLELSLGKSTFGSIKIQLWGHLRRAQHFLMLCLGTLGPTYKKTTFINVVRKGQPGEALLGGNYIDDKGLVTSKGLMGDMEWGGEHSQEAKAGFITGWSNGSPELDAWFAICLRSLPGSNLSCPFGEVVSGLGILNDVIRCNFSVTDLTITEIDLC